MVDRGDMLTASQSHPEMIEKRDSLAGGQYGVGVGGGGGQSSDDVSKSLVEQPPPPPPPPHRDQSDPTISAKKLPKKRKFDLSVLEDMDNTSNVTSNVVNMVTSRGNQQNLQVQHSPVILSSTQQPQPPSQQQTQNQEYYQVASVQPVVPPPQSTAVDYSRREEPPRSRPRHTANTVSIDLTEWRDHRVLALKDSHYYPGVIRNANHGEIYVEFDGESKLVKYVDVLGAGKYDVIGDASPSVGQVNVNARVCVRCPPNNSHADNSTSVFVMGTVYEIHTNPVKFVVKIPTDDDQYDNFIVKRADLRLVQPPWWDELEEGMETTEPPRAQVVGECFCLTWE